MSVLFDSSSSARGVLSGSSGTVTAPHVVNTLATDLVAIVGAFFRCDGDASAGSMSATFGGQNMTASAQSRSASNVLFQAFTLVNPPTGGQSAVVSTASMPAGASSLMVVSATYSGVASIGDIVATGGSGASTTASNSVTVDSVLPAHRVVTIHSTGAVGPGYGFSNYNLVRRTDLADILPYLFSYASYGELILGDGPGAATVTGTATQASTPNWGAFGIPLAPSIVQGDASLNISINATSSGHLYRSGTPSPLRTWVIES